MIAPATDKLDDAVELVEADQAAVVSDFKDLKDEIYQRGLVVVEEIRGTMQAEGRRRCEETR